MAESAIKKNWKQTMKLARRNVALYVFLMPAMLYLILFNYIPMYGIQISFKNYNFADGIVGSAWVGLKWFQNFFSSPMAVSTIANTILLSLYGMAAGFPVPILLAVIMHNIPSKRYKRIAQTITYMPHFISVVVMVGMLSCFLSLRSGWVNNVIVALGGKETFFMGEARYFRHISVWSGVWQEMGWGSIIYMAALTGVDPELHEAAMIDGASKLKRIWHIDLPSIAPTIVIMLIMRCGSILSVNFEKTLLLQNSVNIGVSEVISTYTYKQGINNMKYSYGTAIGMMNTVVNFIFLTLVNYISSRVSETSLW